MTPSPEEIGLPNLLEEDIERLAEECEEAITDFIFKKVPKKSIADLMVSCILELDNELNLEIELDLSQSYDTGHSLDALIEEATQYGVNWVEKRLREMSAE